MPESGHKDVHLDQLFRALLRLHKALLDDERVSYERVHGRIPSNGAFLQLVLGDAWFAWLRPLSRWSRSMNSEKKENRQAVRIEPPVSHRSGHF